MFRKIFVSLLIASAFSGHTAFAATNLKDSDGWKVDIYGFAETDMTSDTTRSFTEVIGNGAVARASTLNGDNGRVQGSARNSRLGFSILAPEQGGWKSKGVLEMDFLGYEPSVSNIAAPTISEGSFSSNPTLRLRHAYLNSTKDDLQILAGQYWSLFGWQPYYMAAIVSIAPEAGELFQRTAQFGVINTWHVGESQRVQGGLSIERPSQKDSGMPNIDVGIRYSLDSFQTGNQSSYGDAHLESLSLGLSGTFRQFETYAVNSTTAQNKQYASAAAADIFVPLIPKSDAKSLGNSLALLAEVTGGTGYADTLPSFTGGLTGATATGTATSYAGTNLDAGFGVYDVNSNFNLIQFQTSNLTLQYMLPTEMHQTIDLGMSLLQTNLTTLSLVGGANGVPTSLNSVYDRVTNQFVNYWCDMSNQVRLGAEYSFQTTHYVGDQALTNNSRVQLTALYRF